MSGPVDIREPFNDLCARLGLDGNEVQQLTVWPSTCAVSVYLDSDEIVLADVRIIPATTSAPADKSFNPWVTAPREDRNGWGT